MKITKSKLRQIIKEELTKFEEAYEGRRGVNELPQYATSAGAKQDVDMRAKRGDFKKGDYGIHGRDWGGFKSYEELPWVQMAVEDLEDAEHDDRVKALEALADELGISIKQGYFEDKVSSHRSEVTYSKEKRGKSKKPEKKAYNKAFRSQAKRDLKK